ncbi:hypothetical protein L227DRAFT_347541 [Lentinus tigrinus ALCF2SS1-6]|uniref:F-box domain-containing protein n=2 Tax=Lentinus tigrinus TaxID=5365 RepID=A0A5C2RS70_9APHY|nr:hypothetical protein L227DRAFT_347541 [Lentinus tigrinus ALCF2SS1-6]
MSHPRFEGDITGSMTDGRAGARQCRKSDLLLIPHRYTWRFKPFSILEPSDTCEHTFPTSHHIRDPLEVIPREVVGQAPSRRASHPPRAVSDPSRTVSQTLAACDAFIKTYKISLRSLHKAFTDQRILEALPIELWERIIDAIYPHDIYDATEHVLTRRTLASCALVCRSWRIRAQSWIFHAIRLGDVPTLRRFADLLTRTPAIGPLVQKLYLVGWLLHAPASVVTAMPLILGGKLPKLGSIVIFRSSEPPRTRDRRSGRRVLPHLPIHPRRPLSFRLFASSLRYLRVEGLVFPSFVDFARAMQSVSEISELACVRVRWSPPSMPPSLPYAASRISFRKLEKLTIRQLGMRAVEILLSSIGPSLSCLDIDVPHFDKPTAENSDDVRNNYEANCSLSAFHNLHALRLAFSPSPGLDMIVLNLVRGYLHSWFPPLGGLLELAPLAPDLHSNSPVPVWSLTRERFVAILSHVGRIADDILASTQAGVVIRIKDRKPLRHWWWCQQVLGCFPALVRADRVRLKFAEQSELG